jgi:SSS family solute:Na+ symporter
LLTNIRFSHSFTAAGLPASLVTDKFQAVLMGLLVIILTIAVTAKDENHVSKSEFDLASNWTKDGLRAAVTLFIAIASAELFNQGTWQRVWAAEDVSAMRKGFLGGSVLVFFLMMFFGIMGMIAYANDPEAYNNYEKFAYLAFFDLLEPLGNGWHIVTLILVTALAASSIDSLQTGLTAIFSHDLVKYGYYPKQISRVLVVAINIPAIYFASEKYDVLTLFLVADLICATSVFPVFLGLQTTDIGILKAPTELGAFLGCISGVVTVLINGIVNDSEGGLFQYFKLENEGICALCGSKTMVSFIITPIVSAIMTYVFTFADIAMRGDRARQPIFHIAWDEEELNRDVKKLESSDDDSGAIAKDTTEAVAVEDVEASQIMSVRDLQAEEIMDEAEEVVVSDDTLTSVEVAA